MTITLPPGTEKAVAERAREQATPEQPALDSLRHTFVSSRLTPDEILEPAAKVYAGLSEQDVNDVEKITLDRCNLRANNQMRRRHHKSGENINGKNIDAGTDCC